MTYRFDLYIDLCVYVLWHVHINIVGVECLLFHWLFLVAKKGVKVNGNDLQINDIHSNIAITTDNAVQQEVIPSNQDTQITCYTE